MYKLFYAAAVSVTAIAVFSCRSNHVTTVPQARYDSSHRATFSHDTLVVRDSVRIERLSDTVYNTRWRTVYRTKTVRDTVCSVIRDSVSVVVHQPQASGGDPSLRLPWWVVLCAAAIFLRRR